MEKHYSAGGIVIRNVPNGLRAPGPKPPDRFKILLIKDSYGRWTWPKGHIEKGEKPEETALREISEETGLTNIRIIKRIGAQSYYFALKGKRVFKMVYIFLVSSSGSEKLSIQKSEIKEGRWFSPEEAISKIEYRGSKSILRKGIRIWK